MGFVKFYAELWAFGTNGEIREVHVPVNELAVNAMEDLSKIFYYGQNDFQPVEDRRSISVGDIIRLPVGGETHLYLVESYGFLGPLNHSDYHSHIQNAIALGLERG